MPLSIVLGLCLAHYEAAGLRRDQFEIEVEASTILVCPCCSDSGPVLSVTLACDMEKRVRRAVARLGITVVLISHRWSPVFVGHAYRSLDRGSPAECRRRSGRG